MKKALFFSTVVCLFIMISKTSYSATITETFSNRLDWMNSVSSGTVYLENFNEINFGVITNGEVVSYENGLSLIGSGGGGLVIFRTSNGIFNTGHLDTDFESTSTQLIFQFSTPIYGFGFDYCNADTDSSLLLVGFDSGNIAVPRNENLSVSKYYGVLTDQPFSSFAITTGSGDQDVDIDNLVFAPIPEPATLSLLALGTMLAGKRKIS